MNRLATAAATTLLALGAIAPASLSETVAISASSPNPLELNGTSGGPQDSKDCGFVSSAPSQVLDVRDRLNSVRLDVSASGGKPTLLVNGPSGRFCLLATGNQLQMPVGVMTPGRYELRVGDRSGEAHRYQLSVTRR